MTNYESIKNMTLEQMAVTLYLTVIPFVEEAAKARGESVTKEVRENTVREIKAFLQAEIK